MASSGSLFSNVGLGKSSSQESGLLGTKTANPYEGCSCGFTLTFKQRLYAFAICFAAGCLVSFLASGSLREPKKFAILYSVGNLIALASTAFLVGPKRQVKNMFKKKRIVATCVYLAMVIITIVVAVKVQSVLPTLVCLLIQLLALLWYSLSWIPYARAAVKRCCTRQMNQ